MGLPLGSTATLGVSAMLNLIGEVPEPAEVAAIPDAHLHLYGKSLRPGRKVGHVTLRAASFEELTSRLAHCGIFSTGGVLFAGAPVRYGELRQAFCGCAIDSTEPQRLKPSPWRFHGTAKAVPSREFHSSDRFISC